MGRTLSNTQEFECMWLGCFIFFIIKPLATQRLQEDFHSSIYRKKMGLDKRSLKLRRFKELIFFCLREIITYLADILGSRFSRIHILCSLFVFVLFKKNAEKL